MTEIDKGGNKMKIDRKWLKKAGLQRDPPVVEEIEAIMELNPEGIRQVMNLFRKTLPSTPAKTLLLTRLSTVLARGRERQRRNATK